MTVLNTAKGCYDERNKMKRAGPLLIMKFLANEYCTQIFRRILIFSNNPVIHTTSRAKSIDFIRPVIPPVRKPGIIMIMGPRVG